MPVVRCPIRSQEGRRALEEILLPAMQEQLPRRRAQVGAEGGRGKATLG